MAVKIANVISKEPEVPIINLKDMDESKQNDLLLAAINQKLDDEIPTSIAPVADKNQQIQEV